MDEIDEFFNQLSQGGKGGTKEEIAKELFELLKSKDMVHVVGLGNFNYDNLIWAFGRLILHFKIVKRFYLDPDKIRSDFEYCIYLIKVTDAMDGKLLDKITEMFNTTFISMNYPESMGERIRGVGR